MGQFQRHPITSQDERQCAAMAQAFEKVLTPREYGWSFAGDGDCLVTLHRHETTESAERHYSQMRLFGGPKRIGYARRAMTEAEALRMLGERFGPGNVTVNRHE